jgi:cobalt-zinc-cadmium efflux system outer membrane protein
MTDIRIALRGGPRSFLPLGYMCFMAIGLIAGLRSPAVAQEKRGGTEIIFSLEEAVALAITVSPEIVVAEGAIRVPRAERSEALLPFPTNPLIEYGRIRRQSFGSTGFDREWVVSQEIEVAGWLFRRSAAGERVRSREELLSDTGRRVGLGARLAYLDLAIAEQRADLTESNASFAQSLADLAARQFEAGEINRLEHNATVLEAARARALAERVKADQAAAAAELARILGMGRDATPKTSTLPTPPLLAVDAEDVAFALAVERRADLSSARYGVEAADKAYTAAKLSFLPNLTLAVISGNEATDDLFGFSIGFSVPLFQRGQSARGVAEAERAVARAELAESQRLIQAEVRTAVERYVRAQLAERRFATDVLSAAAENVTLTETALREGEVSVTDVIVLRTAAVNAQLEYVDILGGVTAAWFQLAAAMNVPPETIAGLLDTEVEQE